MNDTTLLPSRRLRATAGLARWLLGLLAAAWLLFALLVVVLHGWIVPRIGDWRGLLEQQASQAVGAPVRIGAISARSTGLFPTLELNDLRVQDEAGRDALRVARVVAGVSPRSLWRLGFEQLYVERAEVDIRRGADGRLHVAGLDVSRDAAQGDDGGAVADWFFGQREFVVAQSTVRWSDERRGAAPLLLSDVRFVARNAGRRHQMRLDATPPAGWGERFTLMGDLRQPLLTTRTGEWQRWQGQLHALLPRIDVTRLGQYVTLDGRIREGDGALRAWIDVDEGQPVGGVLDVALNRVDAVLGQKLQPLVLRGVTGRIAAQRTPEVFEFSTEGLQFTTGQGERWPGGNLWFRQEPAQASGIGAGAGERAVLRADQLDLGALALIANRLPIAEKLRRLIAERAPQGLVQHIEAGWQGPADNPTQYHARGQVSGLSVAADTPAGSGERAAGTPGIRGLSADFELNQDGGQARLQIAQGALELPGVFEEPVLPLASASAQLQWKREGTGADARWQLEVPELRFANADAEGHARASWHTSDPAQSRSGSRFPGVLDLQGQLTRADGTRVFRYLPLSIPKFTRDYVRDAVRAGHATAVDFRVRGDLWEVPFNDPSTGEFRIAAQVEDVDYAYVPRPPAGARADDTRALPWPALAGATAELVFERSGMQVRNVRARLGDAAALRLLQGEARIANMAAEDALLEVDTRLRGPMAEMLRLGAPLLRGLPEAHGFVRDLRAEGDAGYTLKLQMPLADAEAVKVQAQFALNGNELRLAPGVPPLAQAQGTLRFTEKGFALADTRARLAGGEVRLGGQGRWDGDDPDIALQAQGRLTAAGLQALSELPWLAPLAQRMSGETGYSAQIGWQQGRPAFRVESDLQGLGLDWPAPLAKTAGEAMPLRAQQQIAQRAPDGAPQREQLDLRLGEVLSAEYRSDVTGAEPKLLQGVVRVGREAVASAGLPDSGALAVVTLPTVDVDAWRALLRGVAGEAAPAQAAGEAPADSPWLPTAFALHADELRVDGRTLRQVVVGGSREGPLWRANIDARELSGYAEYSARQSGRLYARLARLKIESSAAEQVESLLDEQPDTLPALDVVVEDFELKGRALGRVEIEAINRGGAEHVWQLNKLVLRTPEAQLSARGRWAADAGAAGAPRHTQLDFELAIQDAGRLLGRFGMADVLLRGRGSLAGQVQWRGSPFAIDYPSLAGQMHLDVGAGQFLQAEPGIAKLLGVLSLQALPRRFTLDFRDIFSAGFAFDFIRGDARIAGGVAQTNNLQMKGVNAAVLMEGSADIAHETQQLRVVVVPEINAGTAALVATAINPAIGLGAFLAQAVLSRPLVAATTREFQIDGTWAEPRVTQVPRRTPPSAPRPQENPS